MVSRARTGECVPFLLPGLYAAHESRRQMAIAVQYTVFAARRQQYQRAALDTLHMSVSG